MAHLPKISGLPTTKDKFSPRSTFMELVEYDPAESTLDITFKSGSVHRYLECSPVSYQVFKESPTHDAFYARAIKGRFSSVKIKSHDVGRERSHPLKADKKRRTLTDGTEWIAGTVNRAGL